MGELLIEAQELSKSFSSVDALSEVDFDLRAGEIHAIVGENGAGKSTLVKILTGLLQPDNGTIRIRGRATTIPDPFHAERLGISALQQELVLVPMLDVAHNISLGHIPTRRRFGRILATIDREAIYKEASRALALVGAQIDPEAPAGSLGTSQAQLVLLARAFCWDMQVLILDEPTAALTPGERDELFARVRALRERGVGILYISHHLDEVLELADRVTVFRDGRRVTTMSTADVTVGAIIEPMLGRAIEEMYPKQEVEIGSPVLEVREARRGTVLEDVSLTIRAGEIVGITGLVGAGKTELARAIFGADPFDSGEVLLYGRRIRTDSPGHAIGVGIALVPEDRKSQSLIPLLSVRDNIATAIVNSGKAGSPVLRFRQVLLNSRIAAIVQKFVAQFRIRIRSVFQKVEDLSGGNQQKVVLAKCLAAEPQVMVLDEPTRGLDIGSKIEIYQAIESLADRGVPVLMLSSEPEEVVRMCDRVLIMRKGRIVAELDRTQATQAGIMRHASADPGVAV